VKRLRRGWEARLRELKVALHIDQAIQDEYAIVRLVANRDMEIDDEGDRGRGIENGYRS